MWCRVSCVFLSDGVYLLRAWGWGLVPAGSWGCGLVVGDWGQWGDEGVSGSLVTLSLWSCAG